MNIYELPMPTDPYRKYIERLVPHLPAVVTITNLIVGLPPVDTYNNKDRVGCTSGISFAPTDHTQITKATNTVVRLPAPFQSWTHDNTPSQERLPS